MYEQGNNKLKLDNITSIGLWVGLALIALGWLKVIPLLYGCFIIRLDRLCYCSSFLYCGGNKQKKHASF
jgi:hypothetical protein